MIEQSILILFQFGARHSHFTICLSIILSKCEQYRWNLTCKGRSAFIDISEQLGSKIKGFSEHCSHLKWRGSPLGLMPHLSPGRLDCFHNNRLMSTIVSLKSPYLWIYSLIWFDLVYPIPFVLHYAQWYVSTLWIAYQ